MRWQVAMLEGAEGRLTLTKRSEREIPAELILLTAGFTDPVRSGDLNGWGADLDVRGNIDHGVTLAASVPGVVAAGDTGRGQSLNGVWTIAKGALGRAAGADSRDRSAARDVRGAEETFQ